MNYENRETSLENFRAQYCESLGEYLEAILEVGDEQPYPVDPYSLGFDDRTFEELDKGELAAVKDELYKYFEINPNNPTLIRSYLTNAPEGAEIPGKIEVSVLRTNRDGVFLQEMKYRDNALRWVVGSNKNI